MEHVTFTPKGVCSIQIDFDLEDGRTVSIGAYYSDTFNYFWFNYETWG